MPGGRRRGQRRQARGAEISAAYALGARPDTLLRPPCRGGDPHPVLASRRLAELPHPALAALQARAAALRAAGRLLVDLSGSEPERIFAGAAAAALARAAGRPDAAQCVPAAGAPELRRAIVSWYLDRHGVRLDPETQVLPLAGARQGLFLAPLACCDPGDVVLVPDPSSLAYRMGAYLAGTEVVALPLRAELGHLPDLAAVPEGLARRARLLFLNYPNNPTGAAAPPRLLAEAVAFARRRGLLLCHDFTHCASGYDGYRPPSALAAEGAPEAALEFISVSMALGLPGWRLGAAVGAAGPLAALRRVVTEAGAGASAPLQFAGAALLAEAQRAGLLVARSETLRVRRDLLTAALREAGAHVARPRAAPYLWVACAGHSSAEYARWLLERTGVLVVPGADFGVGGEGFCRWSLLCATADIEEVAARLRALGPGGLRAAGDPPAEAGGPGLQGRAALAPDAPDADALLGCL